MARWLSPLAISANEIQQAGQAETNKIGIVSSAIYEANLTDATIVGLSQMFRQLKILREDHVQTLPDDDTSPGECGCQRKSVPNIWIR